MRHHLMTAAALAFTLSGVTACRPDSLTQPSASRPTVSLHDADHEATLVVADDQAECPEAGFTSIQSAVSAAAPGTEILVCAGTYHEQVTVQTNGVVIRAEGNVVVDAHGHAFGFQVLNASGVTIEGFRVRDGHEADIFLNGATFTTIRKNVTTASGHDGIELVASHDNTIERNVAIDNLAANACGVNVAAGSKRNAVRHNLLVNNEWGIQIAGAQTLANVISENRSLRNRGNGIRNVGGASGTMIEENRAVRNGLTPSTVTGTTGAGIRIGSGTGIVVRDNFAFGNLLVDLRQDAAATATFEDNRCRSSSPPGLCEAREDHDLTLP